MKYKTTIIHGQEVQVRVYEENTKLRPKSTMIAKLGHILSWQDQSQGSWIEDEETDTLIWTSETGA